MPSAQERIGAERGPLILNQRMEARNMVRLPVRVARVRGWPGGIWSAGLPQPLPAGPLTWPGTGALDDRTERDDTDGHRAHHPGSGLDAWIRELAEAAPPLTSAQRHTLALLLNSPGPVPARPGGAAAPDRTP